MEHHLLDSYDKINQPMKVNFVDPRPWNAHRRTIAQNTKNLKEKCARKVLYNLYRNTLPLDDEYCHGHKGLLNGDIDNMLQHKRCSAVQYFTDVRHATNAPLIEYVLNAVDAVGQGYYEAATDDLLEQEKDGIDVPPEEMDDEDIDGAVDDIAADPEYTDFVSSLRQKVIDKIVTDISDMIDNSGSGANTNMTESAFRIALDAINEQVMKSEASASRDDMIGLAIRESAIYNLNYVFKQNDGNLRPFKTNIRSNQGVVVTTESVGELIK